MYYTPTIAFIQDLFLAHVLTDCMQKTDRREERNTETVTNYLCLLSGIYGPGFWGHQVLSFKIT
jgi:hypothetical protein